MGCLKNLWIRRRPEPLLPVVGVKPKRGREGSFEGLLKPQYAGTQEVLLLKALMLGGKLSVGDMHRVLREFGHPTYHAQRRFNELAKRLGTRGIVIQEEWVTEPIRHKRHWLSPSTIHRLEVIFMAENQRKQSM